MHSVRLYVRYKYGRFYSSCAFCMNFLHLFTPFSLLNVIMLVHAFVEVDVWRKMSKKCIAPKMSLLRFVYQICTFRDDVNRLYITNFFIHLFFVFISVFFFSSWRNITKRSIFNEPLDFISFIFLIFFFFHRCNIIY